MMRLESKSRIYLFKSLPNFPHFPWAVFRFYFLLKRSDFFIENPARCLPNPTSCAASTRSKLTLRSMTNHIKLAALFPETEPRSRAAKVTWQPTARQKFRPQRSRRRQFSGWTAFFSLFLLSSSPNAQPTKQDLLVVQIQPSRWSRLTRVSFSY